MVHKVNKISAIAAPIKKELPLKEELIEPLLGAWIRLNNSVKGNRFLSGISYHQMIVLKIIGRDLSACVTAADICRKSHNSVCKEVDKTRILW